MLTNTARETQTGSSSPFRSCSVSFLIGEWILGSFLSFNEWSEGWVRLVSDNMGSENYSRKEAGFPFYRLAIFLF